MSKLRHISENSLLLASTGELPLKQKKRILIHLNSCVRCSQRFQAITSQYASLLELNLEAFAFPTSEKFVFVSNCHKPLVKPAWIRWTAATLLCSILVVSGFFGDGLVTSAHATALLNRASVAEASKSAYPVNYKIVSGLETCYFGQNERQVRTATQSCERTHQLLSSVQWESTNPLSARSFEQWRRSLRSHRDYLESNQSTLSIRTETQSGKLRAATLRLNAQSYLPIGETLEFETATLVIALYQPKSTLTHEAGVTNDSVPSKPHIEPAATSNNPLDREETAAWEILHQSHFDDGWEATVQRHSSGIQVKAIVPNDEQREQLLTSLKAVEGVDPEVATYATAEKDLQTILPVRLDRGAGVPLAQNWLSETYPNDADRSKFRNDVQSMSRDVLGRALTLQEMKSSLKDVDKCTICASRLSELEKWQETVMQTELARLAFAIAPYTSHAANSVRTISYADAQKLDQAIDELFIGDAAPADTVQSAQASLNAFLFRHE